MIAPISVIRNTQVYFRHVCSTSATMNLKLLGFTSTAVITVGQKHTLLCHTVGDHHSSMPNSAPTSPISKNLDVASTYLTSQKHSKMPSRSRVVSACTSFGLIPSASSKMMKTTGKRSRKAWSASTAQLTVPLLQVAPMGRVMGSSSRGQKDNMLLCENLMEIHLSTFARSLMTFSAMSIRVSSIREDGCCKSGHCHGGRSSSQRRSRIGNVEKESGARR